jgi:integrase
MSVHKRAAKRGARYDVRLRTPDGRSYKRTFRTRREADAFEARELADRGRGTWLDPRRAQVTFGQVATDWLTSNPSKRPSTRALEDCIMRTHLLPVLGSCRLCAILPREVQALVVSWGERAKPRTVRRQYGVLRAVLGYAVEQDYIARSPCRNIKLPEPAALGRRVPTGDELARLADELGPLYGVMAYLGAALGLRWGEVAGLRVGRVDFLRSTLSVAEQITRGERGVHVVGPPKSQAGQRTLAMPEALTAMLAEHLARRGLSGADADALVLVAHYDNGPLRYDPWRRRVWMPACARAGLGGLTFHDLRRTNATALVADGVDLKTAQTRLGHSDSRLTLGLYAQATTEGDRAAAETLGRRFFSDSQTRRAMDAP